MIISVSDTGIGIPLEKRGQLFLDLCKVVSQVIVWESGCI